MTTFGDCSGPFDLSFAHSVSNWESKVTTCAEQAVIRYLAESPALYWGKRLLHVGIGNGALFASIGAELRSFTGITISRPELECFRQRYGKLETARTLLVNKHDDRLFHSIGDHFDVIVDVNLKSFACCEKHFQKTMVYFANSLSLGGILITAQSGIDFGWAGNTAVAYTPGADTNPLMCRHRVLGARGLGRLASELDLTVDSIPMKPTATCDAETLWILRKD